MGEQELIGNEGEEKRYHWAIGLPCEEHSYCMKLFWDRENREEDHDKFQNRTIRYNKVLLSKLVAPLWVKILDCRNCALESLTLSSGIEEIYCDGNRKLKELIIPYGTEIVTCAGCCLYELFVPESVKILDCSDNCLESLEIKHVMDKLKCSNCYIEKLEIDKYIVDLDCSGNKIKFFTVIQGTVKLNICKNPLYYLYYSNPETQSNVIDSLRVLKCARTPLDTIYLPDGLEYFCCNVTYIKTLNLPSTLKELYCKDIRLTQLNIHYGLMHLDCSNNKIEELFVPNTLKTLKVHGTLISELYCPDSVKELGCKSSHQLYQLELNYGTKVILGDNCAMHLFTINNGRRSIVRGKINLSLANLCISILAKNYLLGYVNPAINVDKNIAECYKCKRKFVQDLYKSFTLISPEDYHVRYSICYLCLRK